MIEVNNISKIYSCEGSDFYAVNDVSLELPDKGMVYIKGKSGSGKTTLLNLLSGLDNIDKGSIKYNGQDMFSYDRNDWDSFRNVNMGFIFQEFNLIEEFSVYKNIEMALCIQSWEGKTEENIEERINSILEYTGLLECKDRSINKLSGGQKQRTAVARALVKKPQMIFADEPTGNLDEASGRAVFSLLKQASKDCLVVVVTHDEAAALRYADRIITISDGKVKEDVSNSSSEKMDEISVINKRINVEEKKLGIVKRTLFAMANMKSRKCRLASTIVMLSLTVFLLLAVVTLLRYDTSKTISNYYDEYGIRQLYPTKTTAYVNLLKERKTKSIMSGLSFKEGLNKIDNIYIEGILKDCTITYDKNGKNGEYSDMDDIDFFVSEDNRYTYVKGHEPREADEIAITDYVAYTLGIKEDVIGSTINYQERKLKICGIISTDYVDYKLEYKEKSGKYNEYTQFNIDTKYHIAVVSKKFIDNSKASCKSIDVQGGNFIYANKEETFLNSTLTYVPVSELATKASLLAGRRPEADNEVILSKSAAQSYGIDVDEENGVFTEQRYEFIDINDEKYNGFYDDKINMTSLYPDGIIVTGIYDDADTQIAVMINNNVFAKLCDIYYGGYIYDEYMVLLPNDTDICSSVYNMLEDGYMFMEPSSMKVMEFKEYIDMLKIFICIVIAIVTTITIIMITTYVSGSIKDNSRKIGILRSVGVTVKDTIRIFKNEALILCITACAVAFVGMNIFLKFTNNMYKKGLSENAFEILYNDYLISCAVFVIAYVVCMCAAIAPIMRFARKKPIEVIRG